MLDSQLGCIIFGHSSIYVCTNIIQNWNQITSNGWIVETVEEGGGGGGGVMLQWTNIPSRGK